MASDKGSPKIEWRRHAAFEYIDDTHIIRVPVPPSSPVTCQATAPLHTLSVDSYYELKITNKKGMVAIGVAAKGFSKTSVVGCEMGTWCLLSDGKVYSGSSNFATRLGPHFGSGDVVGCGVSNYQVFFTLNGQFLGFGSGKVSSKAKELYPTISIGGTIYGRAIFADAELQFPVYHRRRSSVYLTIPVNDAPKERYCPAIGVYDKNLVVFGGRTRLSALLNDVNVLDLEYRRWAKLETEGDKPHRLYGHSGTIVSFTDADQQVTQHFLVVMFGRHVQWNRWKESKDVHILDLTRKTWSKARFSKDASHPGLYGHTATLVGEKVFVFGGYSGDVGHCVNNMRAMHISAIRDAFHTHEIGEIVPDTPAPPPRYGHSAVSFENKICIFGGSNRVETLNDLYEYDITTNTWRKPPVGRISPPPRYRHAAVVIDHYMVVMGGSQKGWYALDDVWVLNLRPNESGQYVWDRFFGTVEQLYGHACAPIWGLNKKVGKFRVYQKWSAVPNPNEVGASSTGDAYWKQGILVFGGAAETSLNDHPHKMSNSAHFLIPAAVIIPEQQPDSVGLNMGSSMLNVVASNVPEKSSSTPYLNTPASGTSPSESDSGTGTGSGGGGKQSPSSASTSTSTSTTPTGKSAKKHKRKKTGEKESSSEDDREIMIKCYFNNDIRVLAVSISVALSKLVRKIQREYSRDEVLSLKYADADSDLITIAKSADLRVAFKTVPVSSVLKLHVFCLAQDEQQLGPRQSSGSASWSNLKPSTSGSLIVPPSPAPPMTRQRSSESLASVSSEAATPYLWHIPYVELEFGSLIGKGFFGEVRKAKWRGSSVACKVIYRHTFRSKDDEDLFISEVDIMSRLRHPKVILFLGASIDADEKIIVMEYMPSGSLYECIAQEDVHNTIFSRELMLSVAFDVAQGMSYLHGQHILHRDLTTKNILLDKQLNAKVSDLGLSRIRDGNVDATSGTHGAIPYMAPEVLEGKDYTEAADVYSFGVVLHEIWVGGNTTSEGENMIQLADKVRAGWRPPIPEDCPDQWASLIEDCWRANPTSRPTFQQIVSRLKKISKSPDFAVKERESTDRPGGIHLSSSSDDDEPRDAPVEWSGYQEIQE